MSTEHISYSALKNYFECPYKFKLTNIDKLRPFVDTIFTAFGTAMHETCEYKLKDRTLNETEYFKKAFKGEINYLLENKQILNETTIKEFEEQGEKLAPMFLTKLEEQFPGFEHIGSEMELYEEIKEYTKNKYFFKGFIDLIIKTPDGKYHIIDMKTTSWGWESEKKSSAIITYQLTLYKKFFAQKHNIKEENIETHFCLLKRTAKTDNIEIFRVTSGNKKTENALKIVNNCLNSIDKNFYPKNRMSCTYCEYYKKECK